ncbi:16S rRNA (uracil(1498)-N(3))-methyltransferase [Aerococcaceae bacterium WGS1372]
MQRYFIEQDLHQTILFTLNSDDNHHLIRVMRARVNDKVFVVDVNHNVFISELVTIDNNIGQLEVVEQIDEKKELPIDVTIACGLSKNDKIDFIVQKGTECGMSQFIPLSLERDVVIWRGNKVQNKVERLQKNVKEAAEQSHRTWIPQVDALTNLDSLIKDNDKFDHKLIAYEETAKNNKHGQLKETLLKIKEGESLIIVFGSEGGLSPLEVEKLKEVGYIECSLGPRILRSETAPIYALSAISYQFEC